MDQEINFFGKTNFRNREQIFGIKTDDRRRHVYAIGKTGMGKTNMIQNMAIQDIRNGKGVAIVDPHGEFAEECLKAVPPSRVNDVVYFNPSDTEFPIALNVMEKVDSEYRHLVASGLVGVFKKIWADSWGPRLEYLLRNAILALLEYPTSTLLGVTRILVDKEYRAKVLEKVTDPVVKSFWTEEFAKYHDRLMAEAISPIQNKVGQFLSSSLIRNIVGQTRSSFSVRDVMDNEKILIMNLSKGRIGEDNSALLGAMMITKIQLAAMARVDMPEKERKDFYLYVDEFQNFATESFANILSEARKYRLNLVLAHQYISQLEDSVRDSVFGNVGTLITFRVGAMDAEVLEKEFSPTFYINDIVNLAKYQIYLKLMIDGVATNPFSSITLPPIDVSDTVENADKVIRVSRERYGADRKIVEDKIMRWSGVMKPEVQSKLKELVKNQSRSAEKQSSGKTVSSSGSGAEAKKKPEDSKIKREDSPKSFATEEKQLASRLSKGGEGREEVKGIDDLEKDAPSMPAQDSLKEKPMYEAQCSACGVTTPVPFKPDGRRPVFCKECLKEYRRQQAKLQQDLTQDEWARTATNEGRNSQDRSQSQSSPTSSSTKDSSSQDKKQKQDSSLKDLINKAMEDNK